MVKLADEALACGDNHLLDAILTKSILVERSLPRAERRRLCSALGRRLPRRTTAEAKRLRKAREQARRNRRAEGINR